MRFRRLELLAYGPFQDVVLDLSAPGLHLVHGRNEAGKSTARRALRDLLFGIPTRTPDAHRHGYDKLRVGAELEAADGRRLSVVRKKGRLRTLLDARGDALPDDILAGWLRGISAERFGATFCLDHQALRDGADDIELALGDVGESLFDAGLGGRGSHGVLAALREERDALWTPRGQKKKALNRALAAHREARKQRQRAQLSSQALRDQLTHVDELTGREARLRDELAGTRAELRRLHRVTGVLPLLSQLDALLARRAELGPVPELDADAAAQRRLAERTLGDAAVERDTLGSQLERITEQLQALGPPVDHDALPEGLLESLEDQLGRQRAAASDRPELEQRRERIVHALERRWQVLGMPGSWDAEGAETACDDSALGRRLRDLIAGHERLAADRGHHTEALAALEQRLEGLESRRGEQPPRSDEPALVDALAQARGLGDVVERGERLAADRDRARVQRDEAWRRLEPRAADVASTLAAALPDGDRLAALCTAHSALTERLAQHELERSSAEDERIRLDDELAVARASSDVPESGELDAARSRRDALWLGLRGGDDPAGEAGERFEAAQAEADALADRLRMEAARVEQRAGLVARAEQAAERVARCVARSAELAAELAAWREDWTAAWQPSGLTPCDPDRALAWRADHEALARAVDAAGAAQAAWQRHVDRVAEVSARLAAALGEAGPEDAGGGDPSLELAPRVERAAAALSALERARARAEHLEDEQQQLTTDRDTARGRLATAEQELASWHERWAAAVEPLGLSGDVDPAAVEQRLAERQELGRELAACHDLTQRLAGMDRDAAALAERVDELAPLAVAGGQQIPEGRLELRAQALIAWGRRVRGLALRRQELEAERSARREELAASEQRAAGASRRLDELVRRAGCDDASALPAVEERVARAAALDQQLEELGRRLVEAGEGADVQALRAACGDWQHDAALARSAELEERAEALDAELQDLLGELRDARAGLDVQRDDEADEWARRAEGELAGIRQGARRWAALRLAEALLDQEIESYRQAHQGPVLSRAAELFPRLTEGRYVDVRAELDERGERPVLMCRRRDGERVGVDALSDGTRDQLFLALRVATLERQARTDEPFPLVVDDVLVHFDDRRTEQALSVLAELADHTQVLLFTHHDGVRDAARRALPEGRLVEHELDAWEREGASG